MVQNVSNQFNDLVNARFYIVYKIMQNDSEMFKCMRTSFNRQKNFENHKNALINEKYMVFMTYLVSNNNDTPQGEGRVCS